VKVLVTGAAGFVAGYLIAELLDHGYEVVGLDNFSKYGPIRKSYDGHSRYTLRIGDAKDAHLLDALLADCDHFVAGAAMVGGISYVHRNAYSLLAENERITAASFDAAIRARQRGRLRKITLLSSSMVFESTAVFPTPEGDELRSPPPASSYGFQKLAGEYFARAAYSQCGLPYTIARPFNCVGIGEVRALRPAEATPGDVELALSHVLPDLVQRVLHGQDPLRVLGDGEQVRHYTYGGDLARGIRLTLESPAALNEDFNLSTARSTTVKELAALVWSRINGSRPLRLVCEPPFAHDVQRRVPDVDKARRLLGFEATTSLDEVLDEVIPWIREQIREGAM
jgi:nucleoside-diphosphate-sugar epimerase